MAAAVPLAALLGGAGLVLGCLAGEAVAAPLWGRAILGQGDLRWLVWLRWLAVPTCIVLSWQAARLQVPSDRPAWARHAALLAATAAAGLSLSLSAVIGIATSPYRNAALETAAAVPAVGVVTGVVSHAGERLTFPVLGLELVGNPTRARLELSLAADADDSGPATRPAPRPGDLISWTGDLHLPGPQLNPYEYDARRALARAGVSARVRVGEWDNLRRTRLSHWLRLLTLLPLRLANGLRMRLHGAFDHYLTLPGRALIAAFVLGERSAMPADMRAAFEASGSLHLAAVSGLHVGLVAAAANYLLRRLLGPSRARTGTSVVVLGFVLLTGAAAPVTRASIVLGVATWPPRSRRSEGLNALALAAGIICLVNPLAAGATSFQLSFAAALAILVGASGRAGAPPGSPWRRSGRLLLASLGAQVATLPVAVHNFGRICPYAPLNNLILLPLGSLVITAYLWLSVLTLLWPPVLRLLAPAVQMLAHLLLWPAAQLSRLPGSLWAPGHPGIVIITVAALGIPAALVVVGVAGRPAIVTPLRRMALSLVAGLALLVIITPLFLHQPPRCLTVAFFAVGQGDAALVRWGRAAVLVDLGPPAWDPVAGNSPLARRMMPALWATRVRPELIVLSHPHADHVGCLSEAARYLPGATVLVRDSHLAATQDWLVAQSGSLLIPGGGPAGELVGLTEPTRLLLPTARRAAAPQLALELFWAPLEDLNEGSLALRARAGLNNGAAVLFTGDGGLQAERFWLRDHPELLRADVLKVGHHGSAGSSGERFLREVSASVAVIPVGPNRFGHPAAAALDRLESVVPVVLRTDQDGYVEVRLCQTHLRVLRWRGD